MADTKVSALTAIDAVAGGDKVPIADASDLTASKSATVDQLKTYIAPAAASQAEQEAASEAAKYVAPATQHFHPSAAKFWVTWTGNSTTILASYNVDSVADTGVGDADVTITTDFSSANWCGTCTVLITAGSAWDATFTTGCGYNARAAGTFGVLCSKMQDGGTAAASLVDPAAWCCAGYGDHA